MGYWMLRINSAAWDPAKSVTDALTCCSQTFFVIYMHNIAEQLLKQLMNDSITIHATDVEFRRGGLVTVLPDTLGPIWVVAAAACTTPSRLSSHASSALSSK
jgi:hypothetical protein